MKILNLIDLEQSEIKYKISKFPDGQQNITLIGANILLASKLNKGNIDYNFIIPKESVIIKSHLSNWLDLELIVCTVACLRELDVEKIHLVTPYFVGARSDRKFEEGGNWYLKQVICPVINSLNLASVLVSDPHSWVLGNLLNKFRYIDNEQLVRFAIKDLVSQNDNKESLFENIVLISPDAGASHKIQKIAEKLNYKGNIITCTKERDANGQLTQVNVPDLDKITNRDIIIIDDIADFGNSFVNIVKFIEETDQSLTKNKKYLIVSHCIQDEGIEFLSKYFDCIYTTNSYKDREDTKNLKILNVL